MEELLTQLIEKINFLSKQLELIEEGQKRGMVKEYLKTDDACYYLTCSPNTLAKVCRKYKVFPDKLGCENYYSLKDLKGMFKK